MAFSSNAINATLYEKLNFNFIRDIAPVAGVIRVPEVMLVKSYWFRATRGQARIGPNGGR